MERRHGGWRPIFCEATWEFVDKIGHIPENDGIQDLQGRKTHPSHQKLCLAWARKDLYLVSRVRPEGLLHRLHSHNPYYLCPLPRCRSDQLSTDFGQRKIDGHQTENALSGSGPRQDCPWIDHERPQKWRLGLPSKLSLGCELDVSTLKDPRRSNSWRNASRLSIVADINAQHSFPSASSAE